MKKDKMGLLAFFGWSLLIGFCVLFIVVYAYGIMTGKIPSSHERPPPPVCTCVCPQPERP